MKIGNKDFDFTKRHTYIMGILNVTPDSFSDGGRFDKKDVALAHVEQMIHEGADIIDVGGESTRPGYEKVTVEEEINRVCTMIEAIHDNFDIPVSVDTYKAPVLDAALQAGADMANDIWGLRYDELFSESGQNSVWPIGTYAEIVAKYQKPVCIMHNRKEAVYQDFLGEILEDLQISIDTAKAAGIPENQIILDPGVGFGKTYEHNMMVLAHLDQFHKWDLPLLLATSRKSVIGLSLDLPVDQREEGTMVTSVLAARHNWNMVRVHDVETNRRGILMMEKIQEFM